MLDNALNFGMDRIMDISFNVGARALGEHTIEKVIGKGTQKAIEQGVQSGIQIGTQKAIEQGVQSGIQIGTQKVIEQGVQSGIQIGTQKAIEKGTQKVIEKGTQKVIEQGVQSGIQIGTQKAIEKGTQKAIEKGTQKAIEKGTQKVIEKGTQKIIEKGTQKAIEKGTQKAIEKGTQKVIEKGTQKAIEKGTQKVIEKGTQKAIEKGTQKATQKMVEKGTTELLASGVNIGTQRVVQKGLEAGLGKVATTLSATNVYTLATIPIELATEKTVELLGGSETTQKVASFTAGLTTSAAIGAIVGGPVGSAAVAGVYSVGRVVTWGVMGIYSAIKVRNYAAPRQSAEERTSSEEEQRVNSLDLRKIHQLTDKLFTSELKGFMKYCLEHEKEFQQVLMKPKELFVQLVVMNIDFYIVIIWEIIELWKQLGLELPNIEEVISESTLDLIENICKYSKLILKGALLLIKVCEGKIEQKEFSISLDRLLSKFFLSELFSRLNKHFEHSPLNDLLNKLFDIFYKNENDIYKFKNIPEIDMIKELLKKSLKKSFEKVLEEIESSLSSEIGNDNREEIDPKFQPFDKLLGLIRN